MVFRNKILTTLAFCLIMCTLSACNEDGFYEKEGLEGTNVDKDVPSDFLADDNPVTEVEQTPDENPAVEQPTDETPVLNLRNVTDTFSQNSAQEVGKVDIVWVIDNSGSMGDEQAALARNFQFFISSFLQRNVDFKMAITSTDPRTAYNGKMTCGKNSSGVTLVCGVSSAITPDELVTRLSAPAAQGDLESLINDFMFFISVGSIGSGDERGLQTTEQFLNLYGSNFLRDDAYLAVILVSDEQDHSPKTVSEYASFIRSFKNNPGLAKFYSIISLVTSLGNTAGTRYQEVSTITGGLSSNIKENFYTTLLNIGATIVNLLDDFALSEQPYENRVTVTVNGSVVESGWVFDAQSRSISFNEGSVPPEGAQIEISYQTLIQ